MSLISPNVAVKFIIFSQFCPGAFSQNCWKKFWKHNPTVGNTYFLARAVLVPVLSVKEVVSHHHPEPNSNYEMTLGTHKIIACRALRGVMILQSLSLEIHPYMVSRSGMWWF